ncbi:hypothetical protein J6590_000901 [Homalodisca vitripennis]|nr:hypothetical protein J6590_000901 [Homalodisca vitripennis]
MDFDRKRPLTRPEYLSLRTIAKKPKVSNVIKHVSQEGSRRRHTTCCVTVVLSLAAVASANHIFNNPLAGHEVFIPYAIPQGYLADIPLVATPDTAQLIENARVAALNSHYYLHDSLPTHHHHLVYHQDHIDDYPVYDNSHVHRTYPYAPLKNSAAPIITAEGYLADNPQVAAAKLAYF